MTLLRLLSVFIGVTALSSLSSCSMGGSADVVNPTVTQMDQLDVQWGLSPRKSKGGPRRTFQYMDTGTPSAAAAPASAPAPAAAAPAMIAPEPPAPAVVTPQSAPVTVPSTLR